MNGWIKYAAIALITAAAIAGSKIYLAPKNSAPANGASSHNQLIETTNMQWNQPPKMEIDADKRYFAILKTSEGDAKIELFSAETPIAANNFVFLARQGFYDGTIFHRAISGFMIQGGDPKGDGTGGPGYRFADEKITRDYSRGIVAMANAGPNTNGSQFFIMHRDYPLPKSYVIFGRVVSGMEAVDKIAQAPVKTNSLGEKSAPISPVKLTSVSIEEKEYAAAAN